MARLSIVYLVKGHLQAAAAFFKFTQCAHFVWKKTQKSFTDKAG